jgi:hypothetical protein
MSCQQLWHYRLPPAAFCDKAPSRVVFYNCNLRTHLECVPFLSSRLLFTRELIGIAVSHNSTSLCFRSKTKAKRIKIKWLAAKQCWGFVFCCCGRRQTVGLTLWPAAVSSLARRLPGVSCLAQDNAFLPARFSTIEAFFFDPSTKALIGFQNFTMWAAQIKSISI